MIKYMLLTVVTLAVSSASLQAGDGCGGCKGKDKETEKTENSA